jgi:hypothetical protein
MRATEKVEAAGALERWSAPRPDASMLIPLPRGLGLLACVVCLVVVSSGCSLISHRKSPRVEISSLQVTTNWNGQPVLFEVLQNEVMRFADNYAVSVAQAVDDYLARTTNADTRLEAVRWKLSQATAAFIDATGPNPALNALDLVVLATVSRMVMEHEVERFGPEALPWLEQHKKLEAMAWLAVSRALKPGQQQELKDLIQEWRRQNPDIRYVGATRLQELATAVGKAPQAMARGPNSIFSLLFLDPMAGLDPTAEAIAEARQFAERAMYYSQRMPNLLNWQVQLLGLQLADQPEIRQALADTDRFSRSSESFAQLANRLPTLLEEERKAAIQQVLDGMATERTNWLAEFTSRDPQISEFMAQTRQTLLAASDTAVCIDAATKSLQELVRTVSGPPAVAAPGGGTGPTGRPFDVKEYGEAAGQISSAAKDLNTLLVNLKQSAPALNSEVTSGGTQMLRQAFWLGLIWLVALFVVLVLAGLAFESFRRKMRGPQASTDSSIADSTHNHRLSSLPMLVI